MKNRIMTISDSGTVNVPNKDVRMTICEIANLFGIFYQTAKMNICAIEKSGVAVGDYSMSGTVEGTKVTPDYYGLEMVTALAFRVQSEKADIFRRWIVKKTMRQELTTIPILLTQNAMLN